MNRIHFRMPQKKKNTTQHSMHRSCRFQRLDNKKCPTQLSRSADPSLICPARRPRASAARVHLHDPAKRVPTHGPSRLENRTRRPRIERASISACGIQPPCTTAQKHTHEGALTPALKHRHLHIFERPQHTNQTFRSVKEVRKNKESTCPTRIATYQLQQHISSVFCRDLAGHHPTNQFPPISLIPTIGVHGGFQGGDRHAHMWPHGKCAHDRRHFFFKLTERVSCGPRLFRHGEAEHGPHNQLRAH